MVPEVQPPEVTTPCLGTDECPGQWCDKRLGGCVDCYDHTHCPDEQVCRDGSCVPKVPCEKKEDCEPGVCGPASVCVDCLADSDCAPGYECEDDICRPAPKPCESFHDCTDRGAVCDETSGKCVSCTDESQCGKYERCEDGECLPDVCVPSVAFCVGDVVQVCRGDGKGYFLIPCGDGETCHEGVCVSQECTPGTTTCEKYQLKKCLPNGTMITTDCGPGQECSEDACVQMRHRVLVIFDTSGSMEQLPGTNTWPEMCGVSEDPNCLEAWPNCESPLSPVTKLGHSKVVFGDFFKSDNDDVVFALQRFPQLPGELAPVCLGGYNVGETEITGDEGDWTLPLGEETYIDKNLSEVLLVPFPKEGGPLNVYEMLTWMDFDEKLVPTEETCTTHSECGSRPCLGVGNKKTCRDYENPELRARGWTPLGKSLFYAGEYLRRYVVVDGKSCKTDADCGSPGYFCNEAGTCFDPLRECRLNAIILFTDGGETEYPLPSDFFNPQVQAKRLRYGLGCKTDADCSVLEYCVDDIEQIELHGCHANYCHAEGYCTNEVLEQDALSHPGSKTVDFITGGMADRLTDYNGNPIQVIVNVVDATASTPGEIDTLQNQNRLIALNGGGVHVIVNVTEAPDFLAKLRDTTDAKQRFTLCAQGLGK